MALNVADPPSERTDEGGVERARERELVWDWVTLCWALIQRLHPLLCHFLSDSQSPPYFSQLANGSVVINIMLCSLMINDEWSNDFTLKLVKENLKLLFTLALYVSCNRKGMRWGSNNPCFYTFVCVCVCVCVCASVILDVFTEACHSLFFLFHSFI